MPLLNSPNHFLASLSSRDSDLVRPHLKAQQLRQGTVIYGAEETIEHLYFPHTGVVSFVVGLSSGQFVEAGMLGRNSVVGSAAPLDGAIALNRAVVQVESMGVITETALLKRLVKESETLRLALVRNDQLASAQTQQVAAWPGPPQKRYVAFNTGVPLANAGRAAQQRHLGRSQTSGSWSHQLSPRSHSCPRY
jgi:CRP-like cAMP-binding protein